MSNVSDDVSIHRHKALLTENLIFKYVNVSKVYVWETPGCTSIVVEAKQNLVEIRHDQRAFVA